MIPQKPAKTTEERAFWSRVYSVLALYCEAPESGRADFIYHQPLGEYKFCGLFGNLGGGGKFHVDVSGVKFSVSCYPEDANATRRRIIRLTNNALEPLAKEYFRKFYFPPAS